MAAKQGRKAHKPAAAAPAGPPATARALAYSLKTLKGSRQLQVTVQLPRSTPDSVLNVEADEAGVRVDTGRWGGGYTLAIEWPEQYAGKVRAGKGIEVEAQLQPGRLQLLLDLETPKDAKKGLAADAPADVAQEKSSKKRALDEPGPNKNKKKREKAKLNKKKNEMKKKHGGASTDAVSSAPAGEAPGDNQPPSKKQKRLVQDKGHLMSFLDSIGDAKESQIEEKLAKEQARDDKIVQLKAKQHARKEAKANRKEKLLENLKSNAKAGKRGGEKPDTDGGGREAAGEKKKSETRRISWGQDQVREFAS